MFKQYSFVNYKKKITKKIISLRSQSVRSLSQIVQKYTHAGITLEILNFCLTGNVDEKSPNMKCRNFHFCLIGRAGKFPLRRNFLSLKYLQEIPSKRKFSGTFFRPFLSKISTFPIRRFFVDISY